MTVLYDTIGQGYDVTRRADPVIAQQLFDLLHLSEDRSVLDVGCGSGNYTVALQNLGAECVGVDVSEAMLAQARQKSQAVAWTKGSACDLPFQDASFDGATCVLATHHIQDRPTAFGEVLRVLKTGAAFVLFTTTAEQMKGYWLWEYFPGVMERACSEFDVIGDQEKTLREAGFKETSRLAYSVTRELEDRFLHSGKYRPEIYLDPAVLAGISSFARSGFEDEIAEGVARLRSDIGSGKIQAVIDRYENDKGDYLFIRAQKL